MPNINSNGYTFAYVIGLTVIVAVGLSLTATALKPKQDANERLATMTDILKAVNKNDEPDIKAFYNDHITGLVLNNKGDVKESVSKPALEIDIKKESRKPAKERNYPVFEYKNGSEQAYIIPVRGFGLWDEIWGYVAIQSDGKTVEGVAFDHKGETPGLGANIKDDKAWGEQFIGKEIIDDSGDYTSVRVIKGDIPKDMKEHAVNSISGATITSNGVNKMLFDDLKDYLPYLNSK